MAKIAKALGVYAEYSVDFVDCVLLVRAQTQGRQSKEKLACPSDVGGKI